MRNTFLLLCACLLFGNIAFAQTNWLQGGNTLGTTGILGTIDSNHLDIYTKNTRQGRWTATGNLLLGSITDNGSKLQVTGSSTFTGTFTQSGGYASFGNGFYLDRFPGDNYSTRLVTVARMLYQSNDRILQHLFTNQIGTALTGTLVQIDPVATLGDSQLTLNVLGRGAISAFCVTNAGNTGLGVITPTAKLHVVGTVRFAGLSKDNTKPLILVSDTSGNVFTRDASSLGSGQAWALAGNAAVNPSTTFLGTTDTSSLAFRTGNTEQMRINASGNVGIGTSNPQSKLAVKGTVTAQKLVATQLNWADYVFNDNYQLLPLDSLASYIKANHHLPEVPSEAAVQKNGLDVGGNQAVLLKKIEELALYIIEQQKQVVSQQQQIMDQQRQIGELKQSANETRRLQDQINELRELLNKK